MSKIVNINQNLSDHQEDYCPNNKCYIKFDFTGYSKYKLQGLLEGLDLQTSIDGLMKTIKYLVEKEYPDIEYLIYDEPIIDASVSELQDIGEIVIELHWLPGRYTDIIIEQYGESRFIENTQDVTDYLEDEILQFFFDIVDYYISPNSPSLHYWLVGLI